MKESLSACDSSLRGPTGAPRRPPAPRSEGTLWGLSAPNFRTPFHRLQGFSKINQAEAPNPGLASLEASLSARARRPYPPRQQSRNPGRAQAGSQLCQLGPLGEWNPRKSALEKRDNPVRPTPPPKDPGGGEGKGTGTRARAGLWKKRPSYLIVREVVC